MTSTKFEPEWNKIDPEPFAWLFIPLATVIISFIVLAAVVDGDGRKQWHHYEALPQGVAQVDNRTYIVTSETLSPGNICKGVDASGSNANVKQTLRIQGLGGLFVICARDQTWNDHRHGSINFLRAAGKVASDPRWLLTNLAVLIIAALPGIAGLARWNIVRKRNKRNFAEWKEIQDGMEEAKLRELTKAFAICAIDSEEYEAGIARAYQAGVEPAE